MSASLILLIQLYNHNSNSMVINSCSLLFILLVCEVMWGLHVDYSISEVGHMYMMWHAYLFKSICQ